MNERITVERKGVPFSVENGPQTAWWRFWDLWANGTWEKEILETIDRLLPPGGALLDIGAWVGPIALWAAQRARVVAIEPDAEAYRQLVANVAANGYADRVRCIEAAAGLEDGEVTLWSVGEWASSSASLTYETGEHATVRSIRLAELLEAERFDLIKMDIEGGEAILLPDVGPIIRRLGTPLLLALHAGRYDPALAPALEAEVARWPRVHVFDALGEALLCQI